MTQVIDANVNGANTPRGWEFRPLGEIADITMGNSPPGDSYNEDGKGVPLVNGPVEFSEGAFGLTVRTKFTTSPTKMCKAGDFLICVRGSTTGRTNIAAFDACIGRGVAAIRARMNQQYVNHFVRTLEKRIHASGKGSTFPSISQQQLSDLLIPIPYPDDFRKSVGEQKRIADILDKADAIRRKRQEVKVLAETFQHGLFREMFGDPIANNMNWRVRPFGELAENQDGRRRPVKASDREKTRGEYPYYGASGIIDYVDSYLFDETALLIGEDGANLLARSTPIAFLASGKYWVNNHAHVVTANGEATLLYLATHLNMRSIRDYVTGSAQPKLNQANLNKIPIPCPPLPLQQEFDRRFGEFERLKTNQTVADGEANGLFNSLVQRAFKGGL